MEKKDSFPWRQAMEEKFNPLLKTKTWKLVWKQPYLKDVGDPKHKINLEFHIVDLGISNKILYMEIRHRELLLCQ